MTEQPAPTHFCPWCGGVVTKAGFGWSGKNRKQLWRCSRKTGCGRPTMNPVVKP